MSGGGAFTLEERGGGCALAGGKGCIRSAGVMLCVLATVTVPVGFVLSLYLWKTPDVSLRDHPETLRRRIISSCVYMCFCVGGFLLSSKSSLSNGMKLLGFDFAGCGFVSWYPLMHVPLLFMGPMTQFVIDVLSAIANRWTLLQFRLSHRPKLACVRDYVVAPLAEEIVFRGVLVASLLQCGVSPFRAMWLSALMFSCAHGHHVVNSMRANGSSFTEALPPVVFQMGYTFLFGAYSAWAILRTRQMVTVIVCHAFCNVMGFPDFEGAVNHKHRSVICATYLFGIAGFYLGFLSPALATNCSLV